MNDLTSPFIVAETPNGSAYPARAWIAKNEADYVGRVLAGHQRYNQSGIETAEQARAFDAAARAMSVEFIIRAAFDWYELDSWCVDVVKCAVQLGWSDSCALKWRLALAKRLTVPPRIGTKLQPKPGAYISRDGTLRRRQTCLAVVEHDAEFNFDTIRFWHTDKKTVERVFKMRFAAASPEYTLRRVKLFYDDEANMFGPGIDPDYA